MEIIAALKRHGFYVAALALTDNATTLDGPMRPSDKLALMVGTEGFGLSDAALDHADVHLNIPMSGTVNSLNVAVASGVALFATRQNAQLRQPPSLP